MPGPIASMPSRPPSVATAVVRASTPMVVTASAANLRTGPGVANARIRVLARGAAIEVIGQRRGADGRVWLEVQQPGGKSGWMRSDLAGPSTSAPTPTLPGDGMDSPVRGPGATTPATASAWPKNGRSWDYPAGTTGGVFWRTAEMWEPNKGLAQAATAYPGSKTYLWYKSIGADPKSVPDSYFQAAKQAGITPQFGFESGEHGLPAMRRALEGKGALPETSPANIEANQLFRQMGAWADRLKDQGPVIFRPLSEMNDATGAWEFGKPGNTPKDYAFIWKEMRSLFDAHGATNLRWSFTVLAVDGNPRFDKVKETLKLIPPGMIDNVGLNPYSMKANGKYESFEQLVSPWLKLFQDTGHGKARPVVSEMGVSNNWKTHGVAGNKDANEVAKGSPGYARLDAERATWIREAFAFARKKGFASLTYFTQMNTNWRLDAGSLAEKALQAELAKGA